MSQFEEENASSGTSLRWTVLCAQSIHLTLGRLGNLWKVIKLLADSGSKRTTF